MIFAQSSLQTAVHEGHESLAVKRFPTIAARPGQEASAGGGGGGGGGGVRPT